MRHTYYNCTTHLILLGVAPEGAGAKKPLGVGERVHRRSRGALGAPGR